MKSKSLGPVAGTKGFAMSVHPERKHLEKAIADDGFCRPEKCWHKVAIEARASAWDPTGKHHIRVDAGHIKINYKGWRYVADTPRHVKRSLMLFDKKLYDHVHVREYNLRFRRTTKIVTVTKERQEQINEARRARIEAGGNENKRKYPDMRKRVEGFSAIV